MGFLNKLMFVHERFYECIIRFLYTDSWWLWVRANGWCRVYTSQYTLGKYTEQLYGGHFMDHSCIQWKRRRTLGYAFVVQQQTPNRPCISKCVKCNECKFDKNKNKTHNTVPKFSQL